MLGHVSESESELLWTWIKSTVGKSDSAKASWFAMSLAARKSVAPSLLRSQLELKSDKNSTLLGTRKGVESSRVGQAFRQDQLLRDATA